MESGCFTSGLGRAGGSPAVLWKPVAALRAVLLGWRLLGLGGLSALCGRRDGSTAPPAVRETDGCCLTRSVTTCIDVARCTASCATERPKP